MLSFTNVWAFHLNLLFLILVALIWFKQDASIICLTFSAVNPSDIIRFFRSWILVEACWPLWDMVCGHLWFLLLRLFKPLSWQIFVTITWRGNYLSSEFDCPTISFWISDPISLPLFVSAAVYLVGSWCWGFLLVWYDLPKKQFKFPMLFFSYFSCYKEFISTFTIRIPTSKIIILVI